MCVSVWTEKERFVHTEGEWADGLLSTQAHSCPLAEWGSNRAFCLEHKGVANVCVLSTQQSAERSPFKNPQALIAPINYLCGMAKT